MTKPISQRLEEARLKFDQSMAIAEAEERARAVRDMTEERVPESDQLYMLEILHEGWMRKQAEIWATVVRDIEAGFELTEVELPARVLGGSVTSQSPS